MQIEQKQEIGIIYGNGLIINPKNKKDKYIPGQKTVTLLEQKHIADMLWGKYLSPLSGAEHQVLSFILARTFGFNKLKEIIKIKSFKVGIITTDGILQFGTGLSESTIKRALTKLINRRYIVRQKRNGVEDGRRLASSFAINLDFFNREVLRYRYLRTEEEIQRLLESNTIKNSICLEPEHIKILENNGIFNKLPDEH